MDESKLKAFSKLVATDPLPMKGMQLPLPTGAFPPALAKLAANPVPPASPSLPALTAPALPPHPPPAPSHTHAVPLDAPPRVRNPECRALKEEYELCMINAASLPLANSRVVGVPCVHLYDSVMRKCGSTILVRAYLLSWIVLAVSTSVCLLCRTMTTEISRPFFPFNRDSVCACVSTSGMG